MASLERVTGILPRFELDLRAALLVDQLEHAQD